MTTTQSNLQRFWAHIKITEGPDPCWEWMGALSSWGYARFYPDDGFPSQYAHRYAYELFVGPIPPGKIVCHRCDNRRCVNPNHFFLGTQKDNIQDMYRKGRAVDNSGEKNKSARLTTDQVREIRYLYDHGERNKSALGRRFGVSDRMIGYIVEREKWRGV